MVPVVSLIIVNWRFSMIRPPRKAGIFEIMSNDYLTALNSIKEGLIPRTGPKSIGERIYRIWP